MKMASRTLNYILFLSDESCAGEEYNLQCVCLASRIQYDADLSLLLNLQTRCEQRVDAHNSRPLERAYTRNKLQNVRLNYN